MNSCSPKAEAAQSLDGDSDVNTLDWKVFSELWMKDRGFFPNNRDRYHREAFHWFTQGAHAEMMGRLNPNLL